MAFWCLRQVIIAILNDTSNLVTMRGKSVSGAHDQESTNHSARFVECEYTRYITASYCYVDRKNLTVVHQWPLHPFHFHMKRWNICDTAQPSM